MICVTRFFPCQPIKEFLALDRVFKLHQEKRRVKRVESCNKEQSNTMAQKGVVQKRETQKGVAQKGWEGDAKELTRR